MIFRKLGNPDPEAFFAELADSHPGKKNYKPMDRYRDFRRVFLDTDEGRRVLQEIFSFCGMFRPITNLETNGAFFHEGERNIALKIMTTMNAEPKERPTSTKES
jgi:hypothetical protein